MKNIYSLIAFFIVTIVLFQYRISHSEIKSNNPIKVTTWDAFGYYMYLPSFFIYQDVKDLNWVTEIDNNYSVTGGKLYQAYKCDNGNYVFKYFGGVAIMETPFFLIGHLIAKTTKYEADGFSAPYQYAIAFGALFYCLLGVFILRKLLLKYFTDLATAIGILLLVMATNIIQYISIDSAMSHSYIFPLYVLIIYLTIKWHSKPSIVWASLIGLVIGLATICRPTEIIMLFIPLLWNTHTKQANKTKWNQVKLNYNHIVYVLIFGFIGILPQLIYWKYTSGSFIYDVGSKWTFLNPFFRVLFGWENGWFIYTPITILFVVGLFFIKKFPFKNAILVFCLLNIWIIISWFDWKYGATYSTRALVQSYPVFAFPFTAIIERILQKKWRFFFYLLGGYLIYVNLFQLKQYFNTVLHFRDMNRQYYSRIYLNKNPTPLDMSLLDTDEILFDENHYQKDLIKSIDSIVNISANNNSIGIITTASSGTNFTRLPIDKWLKIESTLKAKTNFHGSYLNCKIQCKDSIKQKKIRLFSPVSQPGQYNNYEFYVKIPADFKSFDFDLFISSKNKFRADIKQLKVYYLTKE